MSKSHIEIAKQLQQNSEEVRGYFEELYKWQNELQKREAQEKEDEEKKRQNGKEKQSCETKNKDTDYAKNNDFIDKQRNSKLKRDCNSLDAYYKAWDTLDVDNMNEENVTYEKDVEHPSDTSYKILPAQVKNKAVDKERTSDDVDYEIKGSEVEKRQDEKILCSYPKTYEIYMSKYEEMKIFFQKKEYSKCLECINDIINYIDYDLGNNNIFFEIEKNWENEPYIDIISSNYSLDKKTEELFILRTKCLINRSLIYHKLYSFCESIQDCSSVILFYQYFFSNRTHCEKYSISNLFTVDIKNTNFKAYYLRGTARYKLKIYKLSLQDLKKCKELVVENKTNCNNLTNVNKSIQMIENIINENKVKKHLRRQHEYTATLIEQFSLKARPLKIEFIPRKPMQQLPSWATTKEMKNEKKTSNESDTDGRNGKQEKKTNQNKEKEKTEKIDRKIKKEKKKTMEKTEKKETMGKKEKMRDNIQRENTYIEKKKGNEKIEESFRNYITNFESDSSLTLSGDSILTDIEETKPILIINSNTKQNHQIKNKINFELLWNTSKIKNNCREQIALLKTAFIEEGIFTFASDKDTYVDILDALIKNKFLNVFEKDSSEDLTKSILLQKHDHQNTNGKDNTSDKEKKTEVNILTLDEYVLVIDILYCMTNFGKDNFVFLFIDKTEKEVFINFLDFVLRNASIFLCNENNIKQKTHLMKKLLQIKK